MVEHLGLKRLYKGDVFLNEPRHRNLFLTSTQTALQSWYGKIWEGCRPGPAINPQKKQPISNSQKKSGWCGLGWARLMALVELRSAESSQQEFLNAQKTPLWEHKGMAEVGMSSGKGPYYWHPQVRARGSGLHVNETHSYLWATKAWQHFGDRSSPQPLLF